MPMPSGTQEDAGGRVQVDGFTFAITTGGGLTAHTRAQMDRWAAAAGAPWHMDAHGLAYKLPT